MTSSSSSMAGQSMWRPRRDVLPNSSLLCHAPILSGVSRRESTADGADFTDGLVARGLLRARRRVRLLNQNALVCLGRNGGIGLKAHAVDLHVLHHALDVVARLGERDALDPVHGVDIGIAGVAIGFHPVADT